MSDRTYPEIELLQEVPTRLADVREFREELIAAAEPADPGDDAPEASSHVGPSETGLDAELADLLDELDEELPTSYVALPRHGDVGEAASRIRVIPERRGVRFQSFPRPVEEPRPRRRQEPRSGRSDGPRPDQEVRMHPVPLTPGGEVRVADPARIPVAVEPVRPRPRPASRTPATALMVLCAIGAVNAGLLLGLYLDDGGSTGAIATTALRSEAPAEAAPAAAALPTPATPSPGATVPEPMPPETETETVPAVIEPAAEEPPAEVAEAATGEAPLLAAQRAIEAADADAAATALEQARTAGADAASRDRVRAQLAVLRGDGAAAIRELRAMTRAYPDDAAIWLALARVLAPAERDGEAERTFLRVLELDPRSVHAHVGIARLETRAAHLGTARQRLRSAREAYERGEPNPVLEARLHVTEGIIEFELGDYAGASSHAERALALDEASAEAHLLLGRIALQQDREGDAAEHLRAAIAGRAPPAEAVGLLVSRAGGDACELADRYMAVAPRGFDAPAVRRVQRRCR